MMWRIRVTLHDRPGLLARVAHACGEAHVNIIGLQIFREGSTVVDEFIVEAPAECTDTALIALFEDTGAERISISPTSHAALVDGPIRYLEAVSRILEDGDDVAQVLSELLEIGPCSGSDHTEPDVLSLARRNGTSLRIERSVPFTPVERARAQTLLRLVNDAGIDVPLVRPSLGLPMPKVRVATIADIESVAALHNRASNETLIERYSEPIRLPMSTRMARQLVTPDNGLALLVEVGDHIVSHGVLTFLDDDWTFEMFVEDAWQGRGLGSMMVKQAAGRAKGRGADTVTFKSSHTDDGLLRAVGNAGLIARVERHGDRVHVVVPLQYVQSIESV